MKNVNLFLFIVFAATVTACSIFDLNNDDKIEVLETKFQNDEYSQYTITKIQLLNMGAVSTTKNRLSEPVWGPNLLQNGETIAPGQFKMFILNIPNGHWAKYRIAVDTGNGTELLLHEQGYEYDELYPPITHWGSDKRTVGVTIIQHSNPSYIYIAGWWDFAGLQ